MSTSFSFERPGEKIKVLKKVLTRSRSKTITRRAAEELRSSGKHVPPFVALPYGKSTRRGKKLDTNLFESYLEDLWSRISEEKRNSFTYIDCLWFRLHRDGVSKLKVLQWIKEKQIFRKKYVFVPVVCWRHWSLLILCHFGERISCKKKKPCMLLLDSFHELDPKRLEPDIRRFVLDIYRFERKKVKEEAISEIPLLIPKVPQQQNGEECGMFALCFIHHFLQSAPENFSLEGYPYFLTEDWFTPTDLESFQKEIHSFSKTEGTVEID